MRNNVSAGYSWRDNGTCIYYYYFVYGRGSAAFGRKRCIASRDANYRPGH